MSNQTNSNLLSCEDRRKVLEIWRCCVPPTSTAQGKRFNGKTGHFFKSDAQLKAVATYGEILANHTEKPEKPLCGPLSITVEFVWPWLAKTPQKTIEKGWIWHVTKPDLDNVVKQLIDELVRWRYIENDQGVSELIVRKKRGEEAGILIKIEPLEVR